MHELLIIQIGPTSVSHRGFAAVRIVQRPTAKSSIRGGRKCATTYAWPARVDVSNSTYTLYVAAPCGCDEQSCEKELRLRQPAQKIVLLQQCLDHFVLPRRLCQPEADSKLALRDGEAHGAMAGLELSRAPRRTASKLVDITPIPELVVDCNLHHLALVRVCRQDNLARVHSERIKHQGVLVLQGVKTSEPTLGDAIAVDTIGDGAPVLLEHVHELL